MTRANDLTPGASSEPESIGGPAVPTWDVQVGELPADSSEEKAGQAPPISPVHFLTANPSSCWCLNDFLGAKGL